MDFLSKNKAVVIVVAVAVVIIALVAVRWGRGPEGDVIVEEPAADELVTSPLTVRGKARGTWFFEANLPVELLDAEGNVIAQKGAQAEGEWMTENFVPFSVELEFAMPETATGTLRIKKDNPSGLPENDASFDVPVRFKEEAAVMEQEDGAGEENGEAAGTGQENTMALKIFLGNSKLDLGAAECGKSYPVTRTMASALGVARAALIALLDGPTEAEKGDGYFTSLPQGITLKSVALKEGVLTAEFSDELDRVGGSCRVAAIRSQITETAKQFPTIKEVVISINGRTEDILQP